MGFIPHRYFGLPAGRSLVQPCVAGITKRRNVLIAGLDPAALSVLRLIRMRGHHRAVSSPAIHARHLSAGFENPSVSNVSKLLIQIELPID